MQALFVMRGCNHSIDEAKTSSDVSTEETKIFSDIKSEYKHFYEDLKNLINNNISSTSRQEYFVKLMDGLTTPSEFFREEKTVAMLILGSQSPNEVIRLYSVYLLGRTHSIKSFQALEKAVTTDDRDDVKNAAGVELGRMGRAGLGNPLPIIEKVLESAHERQRFAITAIAYLDSYAALEFLLNYYNKIQSDENMRKVVVEGVALYRGSPDILLKVVPFLIKVLDDPSQEVREVAYLGILGCMKDDLTDIIPPRLVESCFSQVHSNNFGNTGLPVIYDKEVKKELHENWGKYCDALKKWYETNKDYLVVITNNFAPNVFIIMIDKESKTAGSPTYEYRKTHPWSREDKQPDTTPVPAPDSEGNKDKK
jgi:hypothetical protein